MATKFYKGLTPLLSQPSLGGQLMGRAYIGGTRIYGAEPAVAAFDPTLGGTLTVNHWYDLTDSTTMTFSGANVTAISDKVGSYNITNAYNSGPTFIDAATGTSFNNQTLYSTATIPYSMGQSSTTYLTIATRTAAFTNLMRVWGFECTFAGSTPQGRNDFQPMVLSNFTLWSRSESDSGQGGSDYMWGHDWDSVDYASGFTNVVSTDEQFFSLASAWSGNTNTFTTSVNGAAYTNSKSDAASTTGGGEYFEIGARGSSNGLHQNPFYGNIKHCIVYNGILTNQNIADLYTAWTSL